MSNISEEELIELGMYCERMLADPGFNKLVEVCTKNFAISIMEAPSLGEREQIVNIYQGLKAFLGMANQYVIHKDQIVSVSEQKQEDE